jgi:hypothetical protein
MSAPAVAAEMPVAFPSVEWFGRLADLMNANRVRQEQLGYVDCVVGFRVTDGPDGGPWDVEVTFEELSATDVRAVDDDDARADFRLEASAVTWREMIESIAGGRGRPDLDHTLNRLSHFGTPMRVVGDDVLKTDLYFRYNQSLQEFVNASAGFPTRFV